MFPGIRKLSDDEPKCKIVPIPLEDHVHPTVIRRWQHEHQRQAERAFAGHGYSDQAEARMAEIEPCQEYGTRLQRQGKDVQLLAYPGAPHGFDMPWPRQRFSAYRGLGTCRLEGQIVNRETGQPWHPTYAGTTEGVTAEADPRAYAEAVKAVTAFLTDTFKRP
jgi:dienelactone hydrolase